MKDVFYERIESIFHNSNSQDELFDAFAEAQKKGIRDFELYKILLANPFLSIDEIKMYSKKLIKESPEFSYNILMWTAKIFESHAKYILNIEDPLSYYELAMAARPAEFEPLISLLKLYNYEDDTESNKKILSLIETGITNVVKKSRVLYSLSDLYKRRGNIKEASRFLGLAEKSAEFERE